MAEGSGKTSYVAPKTRHPAVYTTDRRSGREIRRGESLSRRTIEKNGKSDVLRNKSAMRRNTCDHGSKNHALGTGPKPEKDGFRRRHAVRYGDERIRRAVVSGASPLPLPAHSTLYTQLALLYLYGNGVVSVAVLLGNLPQSAADQKQTPLRAGDSAARRAVRSLYRLSVHGLVLLLQRSGRVRSRTCILSPVCLKLRLRYSGFGHQPYRHDLEKDFRTKAGLRGNAVVRATAHCLRDIAILFFRTCL